MFSIWSLVLALATTATGAHPAASVSVTVRSSCSHTVKIRYDSTVASIDSGEVDSRSLDEGDTVAVLDDSEHALDSITVSASSPALTVGSDCESISAR